ncbi:MAG: enoyl-CoA hydratase/isomerase family protein [Deltaproteobacteria bacterium]|nr:enoyl-CoA hydratase/isomerase family protein [Deltaproteobacteria bacterium]
MIYKTVILEERDGVALITLNRPDELNSVNREMRTEILDVLKNLEDNSNIKVVIVTGAGRAFCAGADINELKEARKDPELQKFINKTLFTMTKAYYEFEKPIIGAINGVSAGDGSQWVLAFDINIASDKASFGWPATYLGLLCPYGLIRLPVEVNRYRAKEVLMTRRYISAEEAVQWGFVSKVVPYDDLLDTAFELADEIKQMPPLSLKAIKKAVNWGMGGYELAEHIMISLQCSDDAEEGITAFLEKRKPIFTGR